MLILQRERIVWLVAPFAGAWIEIIHNTIAKNMIRPSLPSRERGLKFLAPSAPPLYAKSLPSRERGLKFLSPTHNVFAGIVAPFAGAWIEIRETLLGHTA